MHETNAVTSNIFHLMIPFIVYFFVLNITRLHVVNGQANCDYLFCYYRKADYTGDI